MGVREVHPNSLANLAPPFKKGKSGNPKGTPKKDIKREDWQEFALESAGPDRNGTPLPSRERMVMLAIFKCAVDTRRKDCTTAQKTFLERVQGRSPDIVHLSGPNGRPLQPGDVAVQFTVVGDKKAAGNEEPAPGSESAGDGSPQS
jgi:hypothetical protein